MARTGSRTILSNPCAGAFAIGSGASRSDQTHPLFAVSAAALPPADVGATASRNETKGFDAVIATCTHTADERTGPAGLFGRLGAAALEYSTGGLVEYSRCVDSDSYLREYLAQVFQAALEVHLAAGHNYMLATLLHIRLDARVGLIQ